MILELKLDFSNIDLMIKYKLGEYEIKKIKNILIKYLKGELDASTDEADADGFWDLALEIEEQIVSINHILCYKYNLVDDIYFALKNIAIKVIVL